MIDFLEYKSIQFNTITEVSCFNTQGVGVAEYMAIIRGDDCSLSFSTQLNNIKESFKLLHSKCKGAKAVFARIFLSDVANQRAEVKVTFSEYTDCSFSIIGQPPLDGTKVAILVYLQSNMDTVKYGSELIAHRHGDYTHYWSSSIFSREADAELQMKHIFDDYVVQLERRGCTLFDNAIRTWIFVQNIDVNYHMVVKARNEIFASQNLLNDTHFIASTGIEGANGEPKVAVQFDSYAIDGLKDGQIKYLYASDHMNRTSEYGVSFERGTSVIYGDRIHTFISGTASIDNRGEILYKGDVIKQAERACQNVEALLAESESGFDDLMHILVYMRDVADYSNVRNYFENRFPSIPKVYLLAPVCRPGWLIEIECISIKSNKNSKYENF